MATATGTWDYRDRFADSFGRTFFRRFGDGVISSIGIGTYLGEPTDRVDAAYREAVEMALGNGCNAVDTAINYRCQRSERLIGTALETTEIDRDAVHVATKGGFLPFDGVPPADPARYVRETFVDTGIASVDDLAMGSHCLTPTFIDHQLDRSLENLGIDAIDLYYVHNPETQLHVRSREAVYDRLESVFERLEERILEGAIRRYGIATWNAFRVPAGHDQYLSIAEIVSRARSAARSVGNRTTGLRAIQLPFNVRMADGFTVESQTGSEGRVSTLRFARDAGLSVFTSASIAQGDLSKGLPPAVAEQLEGETAAQKAINFARSAPGVTCALVGMSSTDHVEENLAAGRFDPMGAEAFDRIFE